MSRWLLLALVGCVQFDVQDPKPPGAIEDMTCHLSALPEGRLAWVPERTDLVCTAKNELGPAREICMQPYVGVRETGAIYTSHAPACSGEVAPGDSLAFAVRLDMRRALCQLDRGGCVIHTVPLRQGAPDPAAVVALARALEDEASAPGRDRPSVRECEGLEHAWTGEPRFAPYQRFVAKPDELLAACLGMTRAELVCLQGAADAHAADACAPRAP